MRITIKYEAIWQNSFLDGSNNEPLPEGGRKFIASIKTMSELKSNFISRQISKDTIMGVLNRLIGDQRKLYQARQSQNYYFADFEDQITFENIHDREKPLNSEMIYIRNITGNTDQNSFTGMVKDDHPVFTSSYSSEFWGILWLSEDELIDFIRSQSACVYLKKNIQLDPITITDRVRELNNLKSVSLSESITEAIQVLDKIFPGKEYLEKNKVKLIRFYAAALYIQLDRLKNKFSDIEKGFKRESNEIKVYGFSKRGFNGLRDFMKNFITGREKIIYGNPYLLKEKRKGEGEVTQLLTKANGTVEINLNISSEKARQLKNMIEDAGVSSFYLGKKGLAYVDSLRV